MIVKLVTEQYLEFLSLKGGCTGLSESIHAKMPHCWCPRCLDQARPIDGRPITQVEVDGALLDVEASFCYLGDMLSAGGGCALAIATRCSTAWVKFRKLLPKLTSKHVSPLTRGKVFSACIRSSLILGCETWAPTALDLQRLRKNDRAMIRWIWGVKPHDEVPMESLYTKLGIQEVGDALRTKCLRWYGYVGRTFSWTNSITSIAIPGPRGRGRPRKSWSECVKADVEVCNLKGIDPQNREAWRSGVRRTS